MARDLCEARFSGNVGRDPIVKTGSKTRAEFSFAVKKGKDRDGNELTAWFDIIAWDNNAEFVEKYVKKGDYLILAVTPHSYTFKTENDETRKIVNFNLDKVIFARGGGKNSNGNSNNQRSDNDSGNTDSYEDGAPLPF